MRDEMTRKQLTRYEAIIDGIRRVDSDLNPIIERIDIYTLTFDEGLAEEFYTFDEAMDALSSVVMNPTKQYYLSGHARYTLVVNQSVLVARVYVDSTNFYILYRGNNFYRAMDALERETEWTKFSIGRKPL